MADVITHFPGQYDNEKVQIVIRKHGVVYAKIVFGFLLTVLLPMVLFLAYWFTPSLGASSSFQTKIGLLVICFYFLFGMLFAVTAWLEEAFDFFIITNERLIDFTQVSLLKRHIASTPLSKIQDTVGTVRGFMGTLFHYGDLDIKTAAGDATQFFMDRIPNPEQVAHDILEKAREFTHNLPSSAL